MITILSSTDFSFIIQRTLVSLKPTTALCSFGHIDDKHSGV